MTITNASGAGPQMTPDEAEALMSARERMLARHKLIEAMIRNNELQLKNESARGGAEIERECARRDAAAADAAAADAAEEAHTAVDHLDARIRVLEDEQRRLVSEREWLNASLLEFENAPSARQQAGHA